MSDDERHEHEEEEVTSAAPSDESKEVGENADVPEGEGMEATPGDADTEEPADPDSEESGSREEPRGEQGDDDDRDPLAREIEEDPASNPQDPQLREIKGG